VDLDRKIQLQVLKIRNEEHIREWMFTQDIIKEEDHLAWIERLKDDQSQICLIITNSYAQPIGAVNLKKIDIINKNAELGFYKSLNFNEKGVMVKSLSTIINYSFDVLGLEKIYTEVFEGNSKSISIHKRLMFVEEGYLRSHIINKGIRIGVHLFGLIKNEWQYRKDEINTINDFIVEINNV
jgi:UDP-4-amino-4,6-dideoxy-N-acetyl-beta-L-altrosamine N-acetyltransferase